MEQKRRVRIVVGTVAAYAMLNDTKVAAAVWTALPLDFRVQRWGDEVYGSVPLDLAQEVPQEVVERGALAWWPPGHAVCLFFGPTPVSEADESRAASDVTVFGIVEGDPTVFKAVSGSARMRIEQDRV
jgi:hypothetical protein